MKGFDLSNDPRWQPPIDSQLDISGFRSWSHCGHCISPQQSCCYIISLCEVLDQHTIAYSTGITTVKREDMILFAQDRLMPYVNSLGCGRFLQSTSRRIHLLQILSTLADLDRSNDLLKSATKSISHLVSCRNCEGHQVMLGNIDAVRPSPRSTSADVSFCISLLVLEG